jgi:hypothetical protein
MRLHLGSKNQTKDQGRTAGIGASRSWRTLACLTALVAGLSALSGCSSSRQPAFGPTPDQTTLSPSFFPTTAAAAPASTLSDAGTFNLASSNGDTISVDVQTAPPILATASPQTVVSCAESNGAATFDPTRGEVIQTEVTLTRTSALAGVAAVNLEGHGPLLVTYYADFGGGQTGCGQGDGQPPGYDAASLGFTLAPAQSVTYTVWWVLWNAITPKQPTGDTAAIDQMYIYPTMNENQQGNQWSSGTLGGPAVGSCDVTGLRLVKSFTASCPHETTTVTLS